MISSLEFDNLKSGYFFDGPFAKLAQNQVLELVDNNTYIVWEDGKKVFEGEYVKIPDDLKFVCEISMKYKVIKLRQQLIRAGLTPND